ncbi:MAG: sodium:phosphate symporter [Spirochaetae bacterium HGW-Spirochaetae-1]|nr:MAG: sodium:phosphate symporter [Spirochaetae bacterium HGW-Spirochaetae-1]
MNYEIISGMIFQLIGGLALFLIGMNNMSNGMQAVAGDGLRKIISTVTNNRFRGLAVGLIVTSIIQSSSITTVLVVGFVNAGVMTLTQSIGVILGADIGTTITGWILVLDIGRYGLPLLGIAGFFYLFSSKEKVRYIALMVMGIGMVFFGLELMKNGFKPLREIPEFLRLFTLFSPDNGGSLVLCALAGAVVTAIIQSSSASVGIAMGMAATGVIDFQTSVALVLGMNIGTTITAFLASLGAGANAKRAAYAHILIKVVGVLWVLPLFSLFVRLIPWIIGADPNTILVENGVTTYPVVIKGIATAHTVFNIANVILFLPFTRLLSSSLKKIISDDPSATVHRLTKLDVRLLDSPMLVIEQSRKEILNMGDKIRTMFTDLREVYSHPEPDQEIVKRIFQMEDELDIMQKEIATFLVDTVSREISHRNTIEAQAHLRIADEYESVSDYITNILKLHLKLSDAGINLTETKRIEIGRLHDDVAAYFETINTSLYRRQSVDLPKVYSQGSAITHQFKKLRNNHLQRLSEKKMEPLLSVSYINMLNSYRTIREYIQNVAEVMAEKN